MPPSGRMFLISVLSGKVNSWCVKIKTQACLSKLCDTHNVEKACGESGLWNKSGKVNQSKENERMRHFCCTLLLMNININI